MQDQSRIINCPQCGNELPLTFRHAKLTVCTHCDSTIFLEDEAVKLAGQQSVLSQNPSLLQLGTPFTYRKQSFTPVGKIRYAYELGYWEEWWALGNDGRGFWISIDEGDFAFEKPIELDTIDTPQVENLSLGQKVTLFNDDWQVTEIGKGTCEGYEGDLPKIIRVGEVVPYVHLSGMSGQLITLEYVNKTVNAYKGEWVDPFDIKSSV